MPLCGVSPNIQAKRSFQDLEDQEQQLPDGAMENSRSTMAGNADSAGAENQAKDAEASGNKENPRQSALAEDAIKISAKCPPRLAESRSSPAEDRRSTSPIPTTSIPPSSPPADIPPAVQASSEAAPLSTTTNMARPAHPPPTDGQPPAKRKRLTPSEKQARKEAEEKQKAERHQEREKKRLEKEAAEEERAKLKADKDAEREAKKLEKEKAEQAKANQKAEREAKKKQKADELAKNERKQMKLTMFGIITPKKPQGPTERTGGDGKEGASSLAPGSAKPAAEKRVKTFYEHTFKAFFVKENVTLARPQYLLMDDETLTAKAKILDEYMHDRRSAPERISEFQPMEALHLPFRVRRGRVYPSVKKIMAEYQESSHSVIDLTSPSQGQAGHSHVQELLRSVPVKTLKFREDVRPPYIGTVSGPPPGGDADSLRKLARRPLSRTVLKLNYDYDSEAEWQEEEGEDVESLGDEEDEVDVDDEMDDFLDDADDVGPTKMAFSGGMEPEISGPYWEHDRDKTGHEVINQYRMEFIHASLNEQTGVDPFSTKYWDQMPRTKAATGNATSKAAVNNPDPIRTKPMAPPPAPINSFFQSRVEDGPNRLPNVAIARPPTTAPTDGVPAAATATAAAAAAAVANASTAAQPKKLLSPELVEKLKNMVRNKPKLSKNGVIELFASENDKCSKILIKNSFEAVTEKTGRGAFKVRGD